MIKLKLPFWLEGLELTKLVTTAQLWWEQATEWLRWPYLQFDADTCHLSILELWAWQRDVTRFPAEPEACSGCGSSTPLSTPWTPAALPV